MVINRDIYDGNTGSRSSKSSSKSRTYMFVFKTLSQKQTNRVYFKTVRPHQKALKDSSCHTLNKHQQKRPSCDFTLGDVEKDAIVFREAGRLGCTLYTRMRGCNMTRSTAAPYRNPPWCLIDKINKERKKRKAADYRNKVVKKFHCAYYFRHNIGEYKEREQIYGAYEIQ